MALRAPILSKQFLKKLDSTLFFFLVRRAYWEGPPRDLAESGMPEFQKWAKNDQNRVKNEKILTFQNGPKWIKVTFKWSKMGT